MAQKKKYTTPLQIVVTPEMSDRIEKMADVEDVSKAKIVRDILEAGIDAREHRSPVHMLRQPLDKGGALPPGRTRVLEDGQPEVVRGRPTDSGDEVAAFQNGG